MNEEEIQIYKENIRSTEASFKAEVNAAKKVIAGLGRLQRNAKIGQGIKAKDISDLDQAFQALVAAHIKAAGFIQDFANTYLE